MTPRRPAIDPVRAFLLLLVIGVVTAGSAGGAAAAPALAQTAPAVDADEVLLSVSLEADGSARWRIAHRVRLDTANETDAFEALAADVEANRSAYVTRFEERIGPTVAEAEAATGRDMAVENVSVTATVEELPQRYGVLAYTFEWTGFAAVEGDRLRAGDALAGLFLDAETTLLVSWPEGYTAVEVSPATAEERERSVVWYGPTSFAPGEPTVVVAAGGGGFDSTHLGLAVVAAVLLGGGLAWWFRRGRSAGRPGSTPDAAAGSTEGAEGTQRPPDELLSNEERVLALLEAEGGRMKQQDVVEALGWTDAKTSQVVGKLREGGEVEGFRLGRENVLRLPGVDDSPADRAGPDEDEG